MIGDLSQSLIGVGEKMPGLDQAPGFKILSGRLPQLLPKESGEAGARKTESPGDGLQTLPLADILGEVVGSLLDTRMALRIIFPWIGATTKEERPFDGIRGEKFASGQVGTQNRIGQGEFLENIFSQIAGKKEMFQAGAEFRP